MRALVVDRPGSTRVEEVEKPSPRAGEVLVRVGAAGICGSDLELLEGRRPAPYVRYPVIPGHEWAGTVAALGEGVRRLEVGDSIVAHRLPLDRHDTRSLCCATGAPARSRSSSSRTARRERRRPGAAPHAPLRARARTWPDCALAPRPVELRPPRGRRHGSDRPLPRAPSRPARPTALRTRRGERRRRHRLHPRPPRPPRSRDVACTRRRLARGDRRRAETVRGRRGAAGDRPRADRGRAAGRDDRGRERRDPRASGLPRRRSGGRLRLRARALRGPVPFLGYVVESERTRIFHAGDTIPFAGLEDLIRQHRVELALLPINGRDAAREALGIVGNLDEEEAARLAARAAVDALVPMHYDMFEANPGSPARLLEIVRRERLDLAVFVLSRRQPFVYSPAR